MQPIASDDVLAEDAVTESLDGAIEIAGPEPIRIDELVRQYLRATGDTRTVINAPDAGYLGTAVDDQSLVPVGDARLGSIRFQEWLSRTTAAR